MEVVVIFELFENCELVESVGDGGNSSGNWNWLVFILFDFVVDLLRLNFPNILEERFNFGSLAAEEEFEKDEVF